MLTAMAQEADRKTAEEAGADGYFTKPFRPMEILTKVEEVWDSTSARFGSKWKRGLSRPPFPFV
jgi:DNA-binding response OmpR family regulator